MRITCPHCGYSRDVEEEKIPPKAKLATCPKCKHKFRFKEDKEQEEIELREEVVEEEEDSQNEQELEEQAKQSADRDEGLDLWSMLETISDDGKQDEQEDFQPFQETAPSSEVPWENLHTQGIVQGFLQTIKEVIFSPGQFFKKMTLGQGFIRPLIFYLLVGEIQTLAQFLWQNTGVIGPAKEGAEGFWAVGLGGISPVMMLILSPLLLIFALFASSCIYHLCLRVFKAGASGFEGTYKVVSYGCAPMIFAVFPFFGPFVGSIWTLVCTVIGLQVVHASTLGRVVSAILLYLLAVLIILSAIIKIIIS